MAKDGVQQEKIYKVPVCTGGAQILVCSQYICWSPGHTYYPCLGPIRAINKFPHVV